MACNQCRVKLPWMSGLVAPIGGHNRRWYRYAHSVIGGSMGSLDMKLGEQCDWCHCHCGPKACPYDLKWVKLRDGMNERWVFSPTEWAIPEQKRYPGCLSNMRMDGGQLEKRFPQGMLTAGIINTWTYGKTPPSQTIFGAHHYFCASLKFQETVHDETLFGLFIEKIVIQIEKLHKCLCLDFWKQNAPIPSQHKNYMDHTIWARELRCSLWYVIADL